MTEKGKAGLLLCLRVSGIAAILDAATDLSFYFSTTSAIKKQGHPVIGTLNGASGNNFYLPDIDYVMTHSNPSAPLRQYAPRYRTEIENSYDIVWRILGIPVDDWIQAGPVGDGRDQEGFYAMVIVDYPVDMTLAEGLKLYTGAGGDILWEKRIGNFFMFYYNVNFLALGRLLTIIADVGTHNASPTSAALFYSADFIARLGNDFLGIDLLASDIETGGILIYPSFTVDTVLHSLFEDDAMMHRLLERVIITKEYVFIEFSDPRVADMVYRMRNRIDWHLPYQYPVTVFRVQTENIGFYRDLAEAGFRDIRGNEEEEEDERRDEMEEEPAEDEYDDSEMGRDDTEQLYSPPPEESAAPYNEESERQQYDEQRLTNAQLAAHLLPKGPANLQVNVMLNKRLQYSLDKSGVKDSIDTQDAAAINRAMKEETDSGKSPMAQEFARMSGRTKDAIKEAMRPTPENPEEEKQEETPKGVEEEKQEETPDGMEEDKREEPPPPRLKKPPDNITPPLVLEVNQIREEIGKLEADRNSLIQVLQSLRGETDAEESKRQALLQIQEEVNTNIARGREYLEQIEKEAQEINRQRREEEQPKYKKSMKVELSAPPQVMLQKPIEISNIPTISIQIKGYDEDQSRHRAIEEQTAPELRIAHNEHMTQLISPIVQDKAPAQRTEELVTLLAQVTAEKEAANAELELTQQQILALSAQLQQIPDIAPPVFTIERQAEVAIEELKVKKEEVNMKISEIQKGVEEDRPELLAALAELKAAKERLIELERRNEEYRADIAVLNKTIPASEDEISSESMERVKESEHAIVLRNELEKLRNRLSVVTQACDEKIVQIRSMKASSGTLPLETKLSLTEEGKVEELKSSVEEARKQLPNARYGSNRTSEENPMQSVESIPFTTPSPIETAKERIRDLEDRLASSSELQQKVNMLEENEAVLKESLESALQELDQFHKIDQTPVTAAIRKEILESKLLNLDAVDARIAKQKELEQMGVYSNIPINESYVKPDSMISLDEMKERMAALEESQRQEAEKQKELLTIQYEEQREQAVNESIKNTKAASLRELAEAFSKIYDTDVTQYTDLDSLSESVARLALSQSLSDLRAKLDQNMPGGISDPYKIPDVDGLAALLVRESRKAAVKSMRESIPDLHIAVDDDPAVFGQAVAESIKSKIRHSRAVLAVSANLCAANIANIPQKPNSTDAYVLAMLRERYPDIPVDLPVDKAFDYIAESTKLDVNSDRLIDEEYTRLKSNIRTLYNTLVSTDAETKAELANLMSAADAEIERRREVLKTGHSSKFDLVSHLQERTRTLATLKDRWVHVLEGKLAEKSLAGTVADTSPPIQVEAIHESIRKSFETLSLRQSHLKEKMLRSEDNEADLESYRKLVEADGNLASFLFNDVVEFKRLVDASKQKTTQEKAAAYEALEEVKGNLTSSEKRFESVTNALRASEAKFTSLMQQRSAEQIALDQAQADLRTIRMRLYLLVSSDGTNTKGGTHEEAIAKQLEAISSPAAKLKIQTDETANVINQAFEQKTAEELALRQSVSQLGALAQGYKAEADSMWKQMLDIWANLKSTSNIGEHIASRIRSVGLGANPDPVLLFESVGNAYKNLQAEYENTKANINMLQDQMVQKGKFWENERAEKDAEISRLTTDLNRRVGEISGYIQKGDSTNSKLSVAMENLKEKTDELSRLKLRFNANEKELRAINAAASGSVTDIERALSTNVDKLESSLTAQILRTILGRLESGVRESIAVQAEIDQKDHSIRSAYTRLQSAESRIRELQDISKSLTVDLAESEKQKDKALKEVNAYAGGFARFSDHLQRLLGLIESADDGTAPDYSLTLDKIKYQIQSFPIFDGWGVDQKNYIEKLRVHLMDHLTKQQRQIRTRIEGNHKEVAALTAELRSYDTRIAELGQANTTEVATLVQSRNDLIGQNKELVQRIQQVEDALTNAQALKLDMQTTFDKTLVTVKAEIDQKNNQIRELTAKIRALSSDAGQLAAKIEGARTNPKSTLSIVTMSDVSRILSVSSSGNTTMPPPQPLDKEATDAIESLSIISSNPEISIDNVRNSFRTVFKFFGIDESSLGGLNNETGIEFTTVAIDWPVPLLNDVQLRFMLKLAGYRGMANMATSTKYVHAMLRTLENRPMTEHDYVDLAEKLLNFPRMSREKTHDSEAIQEFRNAYALSKDETYTRSDRIDTLLNALETDFRLGVGREFPAPETELLRIRSQVATTHKTPDLQLEAVLGSYIGQVRLILD